MLSLLSSLSEYYLIESEWESGMGRPDAVLIPKVDHGDQALVIEYKVGQDVVGLPALAEEGLWCSSKVTCLCQEAVTILPSFL